MESMILRKEVQERIGEIEEADILVGIPSYNNARTVGHVVRAVKAGVRSQKSGVYDKDL